MAGILDGHNIEERSTPLEKLVVDVFTLVQGNQEIQDRTDADSLLDGRITDLDNTLTANINGHIATPIASAHSGQLNSEAQLQNGSIGPHKLNFTAALGGDLTAHVNNASIHFTLGSLSTQAAPGNHTHVAGSGSGLDADKLDGYHATDLIAMMGGGGGGGSVVITGGGTTARGASTFVGNGGARVISFSPAASGTNYTVTVSPNTDQTSRVGEIYTIKATGSSFSVINTGASTGSFDWAVQAVGTSLPQGAGSLVDADMLDGLHAASFSLTNHTHTALPESGQKGTSSFAGVASYRDITFSPAAANTSYAVMITPIGIPTGDDGNYGYVNQSTSVFRVYNSGTGTGQFAWVVIK